MGGGGEAGGYVEGWRRALEGAMAAAARVVGGKDAAAAAPAAAVVVAGGASNGGGGVDGDDTGAPPFTVGEEEGGVLLAAEGALRRVEGVDDLVTAYELRWLRAALAGVGGGCCFVGRVCGM